MFPSRKSWEDLFFPRFKKKNRRHYQHLYIFFWHFNFIFFVSETNINKSSNLLVLDSKPGPSYKVCNEEMLRKRPEWVDDLGPSDKEDSDDSIADPTYEVNSNDGLQRHIVADTNIESDNSGESSNNEPINEYTGRPKKGRKRKYNQQNRAQKKINKDGNKAYFNYKGRKVEPKQFEDYRCDCPKKCSEKVCIEKRKDEFTRFWSLESYNAQTNFIAAAVTEYPKQRLYGRNATKRTFSRTYKLGEEIVCRNTFVKTLGVSTFRVNTALKKFHGRSVLTDQRGITGGGGE